LDQCCADHTLCSVAAGQFLPTRILDTLGPPATMVRLVSGCHASTREYATLSHCWGLAQISRLLTNNQADLERGIPVQTLPATFQHAIQVVRFLGIRYLWIDSLCIIQDSAGDWEVESAAMAKVYGHAHVNIAAASSLDSRGGLFFDRDPDTIRPFAAYAPGGHGPLAEGWYIWKDDNRWVNIGQEPLHRRGWVLQERLLSARTIHFTKSQIFWHCLENIGCESIFSRVPDELFRPPVMQVGDYTDIRITAAKIQKMRPTSTTAARLGQDWQKLIAQYTKCRLSQEEDKLVAVFGMVDYVERLTGDRCLLGLWRSEMPGCLLWLVDWGLANPDGHSVAPGPNRQRPARWRAPSWSWASHDLAV
ncbi:heterokaryon incompatibility protein-domain-containing protein, partial [Lasiosphaeria hispida]